MRKIAIIIGAGPAGLTCALELLRKTDIKPVILEKSSLIGGISRTENYKGNKIDIGGHRFFSKSDVVMDWWQDILTIEQTPVSPLTITYHRKKKKIDVKAGSNGSTTANDKVMLVRDRLSRIYFSRKFYKYPLMIDFTFFRNMGILRMIKIVVSYLRAVLYPRKEERSMEDFLVNRFGNELYTTFFKDYTQKVWGLPCSKISAEWGRQRIKGLSLKKVLTQGLKNLLTAKDKGATIQQKPVETSLIERFLYPKLGPGQMWETVAEMIVEKGGEIHLNQEVFAISQNDAKSITEVKTTNTAKAVHQSFKGDYFFSTMPVKDLFRSLDAKKIPEEILQITEGLVYRDFITVGILVHNQDGKYNHLKDNWIYIQEKDVRLGRLQIFNNWSPHMVADRSKLWLGLEYFCNEGDDLWQLSDADLIKYGIFELHKIKIIDERDAGDGTVIREPKAYPAYFGTYQDMPRVVNYISQYENLFLLGRNGMHKYNNQDHSMLTAIVAVDNLAKGISDKSNIWEVNTEEAYHEEKGI